MTPNEQTPDEQQQQSPSLEIEEDSVPMGAEPQAPAAPVPPEEPAAVADPVDTLAQQLDGDADVEEEPFVGRRGVNLHAEMTHVTSVPHKRPLGPNEMHLPLPSADVEEQNRLADRYPNGSDFGTGEEGERWLQTVVEAQTMFHRGNALLSSLTREDSLWKQQIQVGAETLSARRPSFGEGTESGEKLTGVQAMLKLQASLGLGAVVRVPLYHTGIWVVLKAPSEAALLELDRRIANEKILLGRVTNGLIFSNSSVYQNSYLMNFALAHIYEATYKYTDINELKSIIKLTDLPTLLWGLICTIYPNGYPFKQPCITDPTKCQHVVEELLNIQKLSWTDEASLSDKQRRHMLRKTAKFTLEEIQAYQSEHSFTKKGTLKLHERLTAELKVPTLEEYEQSGFAWVDGIVKSQDQAFGGTIKGEERNQYIMEQAQVTALRQYAHWIEKLVLHDPKGDKVIDDRKTLEDSLSMLTASEEVFTTFFNGAGAFIDNTTISLIAVPKYNCPNCGEPMPDEEKKHPHLIPLDVSNIFFTLQGHRISKVLQRSQL